MIVTIRRLDGSKTTVLEIDDSKCDALLDKFAREFQTPNPEADARWAAMIARRDAVETAKKLRKGRR